MTRLKGLAQIRDAARQAGQGLLDALFPIECAGCGKSGNVICDRCAESLPALVPPFCRVCSVPGDFGLCQPCAETERWFDGIRSPYRYEGAVRKAILALKYGGIKAAAPQLGDMLADYLSANPLGSDAVVPVPMHRARLRERGYNQAGLLAQRVAMRCGVEYRPEMLVRTRAAQPQAGTSNAAERVANVAGSVAAPDGLDLGGRRILLVDDVATTGSTLSECAAALKGAGAESVWCLTFAVAGGGGVV